jgi:hypothetical protein
MATGVTVNNTGYHLTGGIVRVRDVFQAAAPSITCTLCTMTYQQPGNNQLIRFAGVRVKDAVMFDVTTDPIPPEMPLGDVAQAYAAYVLSRLP